MEVRILIGGMGVGRWVLRVNKICFKLQQNKELLAFQARCQVLVYVAFLILSYQICSFKNVLLWTHPLSWYSSSCKYG